MRIALVTPLYRPEIGGVELHVERLARGLAANGHEVEVLTQARGGAAAPTEEILDGALVRRFPIRIGGRHYAFAPGLGPFLRRHARRFELVHAHNYHALPALLAAVASRAPLVLTPHYHGASESPVRNLLHRPYRLAGRRLLGRAARVISVSRPEAALIARDFPAAAAKVAVIPNGVDTAAIAAASPFPRREEKIVLSAGRLEPYKRVELAVRAMHHLDRGYVLRVAGDGPGRESLQRLIEAEGLGDRVRLLGRVERAELNRWFRSADVFVSMSTLEAMGIAPLEALCGGAAVVASDIPAHRESAGLGSDRFTLVAADAGPAALAAAIAAVPGRDEGGGVPSTVPDWEQVVARTEAIYREAAA